MNTRINEAALPAEEWDFRRCSEDERAACHHYEYAREYISEQPELAGKLARGYRPPPYDNFLKFVSSDKANPDSLPMRCPDFPLTPWLGLSPKTRTMLIAQCQVLPEKNQLNSHLLVEDEFDVAYLQALDEKREMLFSQWMKDNREQDDRQSSGLSHGVLVVEESIERPSLCNGPKRYYAVAENAAYAVIQLDWRKSDRALKAAFQRLLKRRPESMAHIKEKPTKGGRGGVTDQLKKLGAKRMRAYYGSSETAVEAIQLAYDSTRNKPPYTDADALREAASKAGKVLKRLQHAGRFRAFDDL